MTEVKYAENSPGVPSYLSWSFYEKHSDIALVIPVINEGEKFLNQLSRIRHANFPIDVIIADGDSSDGSTSINKLKPLGVRALLVKKGPGKLSSQLRMSIDWCAKQNYLIIITIDGNGKDDISAIPQVVKLVQDGYDFVQGSRFVAGGKAINTPPLRLFAIRMIHSPLTSIAARFRYTDTTNGFRGFSMRALLDPKVAVFREIFYTYELLAYLPIRFSRLGYKVIETPVTREYPDSSQIPTKIRGFRSHFLLLKVLLRATFGFYNPRRDFR